MKIRIVFEFKRTGRGQHEQGFGQFLIPHPRPVQKPLKLSKKPMEGQYSPEILHKECKMCQIVGHLVDFPKKIWTL